MFDTPDAHNIVGLIDKSTIRLEKAIESVDPKKSPRGAAGDDLGFKIDHGSKSPRGESSAPKSPRGESSAPKSPRGGGESAAVAAPKSPRGAPAPAASATSTKPAIVPNLKLFDPDAQARADATHANQLGPKKKLSEIEGLRYNIKVKRVDGTKQRVICIVNQEGIILVDPTNERALDANHVTTQRYAWDSIISARVSNKELHVITSTGVTVLITPDAHSLLEEINRHAILGGKASLNMTDDDEDARAIAVAQAARVAVSEKGVDATASGAGFVSPRGDKSPRGAPAPQRSADASYNAVTGHVIGNTKSRDFAPAAFAKLRAQWRINADDYAAEWDVHA